MRFSSIQTDSDHPILRFFKPNCCLVLFFDLTAIILYLHTNSNLFYNNNKTKQTRSMDRFEMLANITSIKRLNINTFYECLLHFYRKISRSSSVSIKLVSFPEGFAFSFTQAVEFNFPHNSTNPPFSLSQSYFKGANHFFWEESWNTALVSKTHIDIEFCTFQVERDIALMCRGKNQFTLGSAI